MTDSLFKELRVLDIATVIAAPVAATMLADFGADVIKVEQPGEGDLLRLLSYIPTTPDADSNYFWQMDGRNKRSLTLNLKHAEGMAVLHKLIATCDVFITNQPLPVRRSLKLGYDDIKRLNPKVIYASLTAYGEDGPHKDGKGFDLVAYWARSGLMDLVRDAKGIPSQALPGMGDHPTAVALYASIVTALLQRERTGEGALVHTSLLANGLWSAASIAQGGFAGGDIGAYRERNSMPSIMGRVYVTEDNRHLQFTMVRSEAEIERLFDVLGLTAWRDDERFKDAEARFANRAVLSDMIQSKLRARSSDAWLDQFGAANVAVNRVSTLEETLRDEQITINGMAVPPVDDDVGVPLIINHPVNVSSVTPIGPKRAPELGEHTREILLALGYSDADIDALRGQGAV